MSTSVTAKPFDKVFISPLQSCLTFLDFQDADGLVRGESCGGMVLESRETGLSRMSILGSMTNSDSLTLQPGQPDQDAEEYVIASALESAGASGMRIIYTEMHGEHVLFQP